MSYSRDFCALVALVRAHPNLGVPVSYSQDFSSCRGRLSINIRDVTRTSIIARASRWRETGLVWTCFRVVCVMTHE